MAGEIEYRVRPGETTEVVNAAELELKTVPVWEVTRVVDSFGWHIGKYRTAKAAQKAADALAALSGDEIP